MKPEFPDPRDIAFRTPAGFLAFGFGSGLVPLAPGTAGTLAAIPFGILLMAIPIYWQWLAVVVAFFLGIWICQRATDQLGVHDHGGIVWDEMVGFWLVLMFVPPTLAGFSGAFVLFRLFDIVKPWPIRWLDRKLKGGLGIMLDDVVAAVFAILVWLLAGRILQSI